jgi:RHS repeat-associated protein
MGMIAAEWFTGKNRDNETGFDWFKVRYMSGAQGRFQSVDPGNAGAALGNPQTWNAYSYVANNPLSYTDPSGLGFWSDLLDAAGFASKIAGDILTLGFGGFFGGEALSGVLGAGGSDAAWSEELPIGVDWGGGIATGDIFGSGSTGPFIFSLQGAARWACASDFGSSHSIAAGVGALFPEVNNNDAAKFAVGLFGGTLLPAS